MALTYEIISCVSAIFFCINYYERKFKKYHTGRAGLSR